MAFRIDVDLSRAMAKLSAVETVQVPFAASRAINDTLVEAQKALRAEFRNTFTLRRAAFIDREGAKITFSKKDNLTGSIGITERAAFLAKQVYGGERPKKGAKIAIPLEGARRGKTGLVQASQRPRAVLAKGAFIRGSRSEASAIMQAIGRGKRKTLKALWLLVPRAFIRKTVPYHATVQDVARRTFADRFRTRLREAMETAK